MMEPTGKVQATQRRLWLGRLPAVLIAGLVGLASLVGTTTAGAQTLPLDTRTILVNGYGTASAPAETARIQFLIGGSFGMGMGMGMAIPAPESAIIVAEGAAPATEATPPTEEGGEDLTMPVEPAMPIMPPPLSEADLDPVVQAIVEAGANPDAVQVVTGPAVSGYYGPGGPGVGLIEVLVEQPSLDQVTAIVDAAAAASTGALLLQQVGVEFDVADCAPLVEAARQQAIADGTATATALAEQLGVTLGDPVQVSDYSSFGPPPADDAGCAPSPDFGYYGPGAIFNTPPFNPLAAVEARAYAQLTMTFAFESSQP